MSAMAPREGQNTRTWSASTVQAASSSIVAGCLVDEVFLAQSASVQACAAAGKLAALACECLQHSIERVVAVRGLLTGYGAGDCITP